MSARTSGFGSRSGALRFAGNLALVSAAAIKRGLGRRAQEGPECLSTDRDVRFAPGTIGGYSAATAAAV
jgi:hypothetical protein